MNDGFAAIAEEIQKSRTIAVLSHVRPDGDAIGSQLALTLCLSSMGKMVDAWNEDGLPEAFHFLRKSELVTVPPLEAKSFDLVIALDTATRDRLGSCLRAVKEANSWVNIDHHASNPRYGDLNYLDLTAPATGQIVFDLVQDQGYPLNREIAEALFVAISTDTGSFRYRNTSAHTFEVVAELVRRGVDVADISHYLYESQPKRRVLLLHELLQHAHFYANDQIATMALTLEKKKQLGIQPADTDGLIDVVRGIETVIVAILFEELENNRVRVSMRSKNAGIDVNKICGEFGGGGHPLAAGARIRGALEDVEKMIANRVSNEIARLH
jgi:bifunctional oligoribonuclease and PAP phosphatase NrnA